MLSQADVYKHFAQRYAGIQHLQLNSALGVTCALYTRARVLSLV